MIGWSSRPESANAANALRVRQMSDAIIIVTLFLGGCIAFFGFLTFAVAGLSEDSLEEVMRMELQAAKWEEEKKQRSNQSEASK